MCTGPNTRQPRAARRPPNKRIFTKRNPGRASPCCSLPGVCAPFVPRPTLAFPGTLWCVTVSVRFRAGLCVYVRSEKRRATGERSGVRPLLLPGSCVARYRARTASGRRVAAGRSSGQRSGGGDAVLRIRPAEVDRKSKVPMSSAFMARPVSASLISFWFFTRVLVRMNFAIRGFDPCACNTLLLNSHSRSSSAPLRRPTYSIDRVPRNPLTPSAPCRIADGEALKRREG